MTRFFDALSDIERLEAAAREADETLHMDEDTFRAFYERTSRALWVYLSRVSGDAQLADDLLQASYYRFLRAARACTTEAHRRNYLFRIATNLVRDTRRRRRVDPVHLREDSEHVGVRVDGDAVEHAERRADLARAMARLSARERNLLWLAYAQGSSHQEIAEVLGLRTSSIKMLLFRARRRLATLLRGGSLGRKGLPS